MQVYEMNVSLSNFRQTTNQSDSADLEDLKDRIDMIDSCGGSIVYSQAMIEANLETMGLGVNLLSSTMAQYE